MYGPTDAARAIPYCCCGNTISQRHCESAENERYVLTRYLGRPLRPNGGESITWRQQIDSCRVGVILGDRSSCTGYNVIPEVKAENLKRVQLYAYHGGGCLVGAKRKLLVWSLLGHACG